MANFFGPNSNCPICKMMRSLAFSGIGAAIGLGIGNLLELDKADTWLSAIAGAFVMVFIVMKKLEKS
ncbi:MAG: hypothetical protein COB26_02815 [Piscirickettsiaceae bacterium]|nr:MAG: hypothetical protein COB89_05075 [Piscirickettsiaceae bacterium]PCI71006.1 MAG: hypothetical protein COB26_02815 [Piscirickettsiaceae bacterium]